MCTATQKIQSYWVSGDKEVTKKPTSGCLWAEPTPPALRKASRLRGSMGSDLHHIKLLCSEYICIEEMR